MTYPQRFRRDLPMPVLLLSKIPLYFGVKNILDLVSLLSLPIHISILYRIKVRNSCKTRTKDKYRVVYTDHQRVELEKEFYYSRYITIRRKAELASNLGLSERQVKIWFQNRRAKERKQVKKREEFTQKDNSMTMGHMTQQQIIHSNPTQIGQNIMTSQIM
ncbi:homeobox protein CDX-1-like [Zophobas morio]|uniref:homeobox protein CDX-1-like n=1 Tax=Zophobas morio TaxID=2755281 RepID=UPI003082C1F3